MPAIRSHRVRVLFSLVIILLIASSGLSACRLGATPEPTPTNTPEPTNTPVPTDTPVPTATSTPEPTNTPVPTDTPVPTATPDRTATAVADFMSTYGEVFTNYELSTDGSLIYLQATQVEINPDSYKEFLYDPIKAPKTGDFVLHTEITWDSSFGLAGCGVKYRSDADYGKGDNYNFYMLRLSGAPGWDIEYNVNGIWNKTITGDRIVYTRDIDDDSGSTNQVDIVVMGDKHTVYINGEKQTTYSHGKLENGLFAFVGWQESGTTSCIFNNTWIWSYD